MIYYFDIGLHKGQEVNMFINICNKNKWNYQIYGFEAHPALATEIAKIYKDNNRVNIFDKAIADKNGPIKLYLARGNNGEGNSIFDSKNNVSKDNYVETDSIKFSEWIQNTFPNFKEQYNILRFNIEGAEWYLMHDLIESGLYKYFKIICGSYSDIFKVSEIKDKQEEYNKLLNDHNIKVHRFTYVNPSQNSDIEGMIQNDIK